MKGFVEFRLWPQILSTILMNSWIMSGRVYFVYIHWEYFSAQDIEEV